MKMRSRLRAPRFYSELASKHTSYGFTIIEVALVLAIAGLIFLVVFLALPALQKSQRDTARRQDVAKAVAAIQQFYADGNTYQLPSASGGASIVNAKLPDAGVLGSYLVSAGFSANTTDASIYNNAGNIEAYPYLGKIEFFFGEKCGGRSSDGHYYLTSDEHGKSQRYGNRA